VTCFIRHATYLTYLLQCLEDLRISSVVHQEQTAAAVVLQTEKQFEKLSVDADAVATQASTGISLSSVASTSSYSSAASAAVSAAAAAAAAAAGTATVSDVFRFSVAHPEDAKLAKKLDQNDPSAALCVARFRHCIFVTL
jgi:hypothetical protein